MLRIACKFSGNIKKNEILQGNAEKFFVYIANI